MGLRLVAALLVAFMGQPASADAVRLLDGHGDATRARFELYDRARQRIEVAYFIYADDRVGLAHLGRLLAAADRGVEVRLLVDWQWNRIAQPVMRALIAGGIDVRLYHPFRFHRPLRFTRRMHDKLLIVDGEHLVLGGRNIEDGYFGLSNKRNYIDRDVYARGRIAATAQHYFLEVWASDRVEEPVLDRARLAAWKEAEARLRRAVGDDLGFSSTPVPSPLIEVGDIDFLHDPLGARRKEAGIREDLVAELEGARERVWIESPYLVLSKGMRATFDRLFERGVAVRVLTNSMAATDNAFAQAGYVRSRKNLLRMGFGLWESKGPEALHSKSMLIDRRRVVIGSYNLDPRSALLNTEVALVIDDGRFARQLEHSMECNLDRAWRIGPDNRPIGEEKRYPGTGWWRRLRVRLIRLLVPFIRKQL